MAARHLLALGHRRLGALGPRAEGDARDFRGEERLAGFAAVLQEQDVARAVVIDQERVPLSFEQGARSLAALLEVAPDVEAVFAVSDLLAVGALMECHRRGIRVPEGSVADRLRRLRDRPAMRAGADDDPDRRP